MVPAAPALPTTVMLQMNGCSAKSTLTVVGEPLTATVHWLPLAEVHPLQLPTVEVVGSGDAVSVTIGSAMVRVSSRLQVPGQAIPPPATLPEATTLPLLEVPALMVSWSVTR